VEWTPDVAHDKGRLYVRASETVFIIATSNDPLIMTSEPGFRCAQTTSRLRPHLESFDYRTKSKL